MFDDLTLAKHGEPDFGAIRARAEVLAALCRAPLPGGDPGLIEAARRLAEVSSVIMAMEYTGEAGIRIEHEIIEPIVNAAEGALIEVLDRQPPETLTGAAVKLRHYLAFDDDAASLRQILAVIERVVALIGGGAAEAAGDRRRQCHGARGGQGLRPRRCAPPFG